MSMEKAVALKYTSGLPAPFILAKGKRALAARMRRIAEDNGVNIIHDEELAESLFLFEAGSFIPEYLYETVAELLAFVYAVERGHQNMIQEST